MVWTAWLFLALALSGAWLTWNLYRPVYEHKQLSGLSFFAGWITGELALHWIVIQAAITAGLVYAGALTSPVGWLALAITGVCWGLLAYAYWHSHGARPVVAEALRAVPAGRAPEHPEKVDWKRILQPFPLRHPEVEKISAIRYHRARGIDLHLDVYHQKGRPSGCPVLLQIHGGAWVTGSRTNQAVPLMQHLASRGWVCVSADYRLSPHATFPDHLIDCKRAIQWVREHAAEYGGDPDFVVVTGGSAGGHLCSLVALTANDPEYQPGFESVDTSVRGCVPFYGVYDFADRDGHFPHDGLQELLERQVMKASLAEAPEAYDRASPVARVSENAPPFFVIHGDRDTLAPVAAARRFVETLREKSRSPVYYAEIPGAQHAFEIFRSLRTHHVIEGVTRFCESLREDKD